jgi:hypothetical protein
MAPAYGSSAHLLIRRETASGQAATGNHSLMGSAAATRAAIRA